MYNIVYIILLPCIIRSIAILGDNSDHLPPLSFNVCCHCRFLGISILGGGWSLPSSRFATGSLPLVKGSCWTGGYTAPCRSSAASFVGYRVGHLKASLHAQSFLSTERLCIVHQSPTPPHGQVQANINNNVQK